MTFIDMRSLPPDEKRLRRQQVVFLRDAGRSHVDIARLTGLSRTGVFDICKRHDAADGINLRDVHKGGNAGAPRLLTSAQEDSLRLLIADHTPDQLGVPGLLWTRAGVQFLIEQRCGIRVRERTTRTYIVRWGFGQHPHEGESDPAALRGLWQWMDDDYRAVLRRSRSEAAEIHWGSGRLTLQRDHAAITLLSTVTNRGQRYWMSAKAEPGADALTGFLRRLTSGRMGKVLLIPGTLPIPGNETLAAWLARNDELIEVLCLPGSDASAAQEWSSFHRPEG